MFCVCSRVEMRGGISGVAHTCTVFLVVGELEPGTALARHPPLAWSLPADVGTAMVLVHAVHPICAEERHKKREDIV